MIVDTKVIKKAMGEQLMNQRILAEISGIPRQTVNTTLNRGTCSVETAAKLAVALNLSPGEFVTGA